MHTFVTQTSILCETILKIKISSFLRRSMEGDDKLGETALLWGTVPTVQTAHGEAPGLPVPTATKAHLHRRRQETAHLGVQATDAPEKARYEKFMVNHIKWSEVCLLWFYMISGFGNRWGTGATKLSHLPMKPINPPDKSPPELISFPTPELIFVLGEQKWINFCEIMRQSVKRRRHRRPGNKEVVDYWG